MSLLGGTGDPPLLAYYLQERLGITIKRKKTQEVVKHPLKVSTDPNWKVGCVLHCQFLIMTLQMWQHDSYLLLTYLLYVLQVEEKIPKVLKKPVLMNAPCPFQTHVEKSEATVERTRESEGENSGDDTLQENTEPFFVTQVCTCPVFVVSICLLCFSLSIYSLD